MNRIGPPPSTSRRSTPPRRVPRCLRPSPRRWRGHESDGEEGEDKGFASSTEAGRRCPRFARARQNEVGLFSRSTRPSPPSWAGRPRNWSVNCRSFHPPRRSRTGHRQLDGHAGPGGPVSRIRLRHRHRDGSWIWIEVTNQNLLRDPDCGYVVAEMVNVSDEMAAMKRCGPASNSCNACRVSSGRRAPGRRRRAVVYTNNRLQGILGTPAAATLEEQLAGRLGRRPPRSARLLRRRAGRRLDSDLEVGWAAGPTARIRHGGAAFSACGPHVGHRAGHRGHRLCGRRDRERPPARRTASTATFDDITQCHNRASTMAPWSRCCPTRCHQRPAVIFVDLNRFKKSTTDSATRRETSSWPWWPAGSGGPCAPTTSSAASAAMNF